MSYQYIKGAHSASLGSGGVSEFTGSFVKLQAMGADGGESTLSRVEFGQLTVPLSSWTPTSKIETPVTVPNGFSIDGPIGAFKVSAGAFLAYWSKKPTHIK